MDRRRHYALFFSLLLTLPSAAQQTVVTYWTFAPRLTEQLIEKFHDLYPDIRVEVVPMEFQDLHEKLIVALAAGGAPDFAMVEIQEIGRMVNEAGPVLQDFFGLPLTLVSMRKTSSPTSGARDSITAAWSPFRGILDRRACFTAVPFSKSEDLTRGPKPCTKA